MVNQNILQAPENCTKNLDISVQEILSVLSDRIYSTGDIEDPTALYNEIKAFILRNSIIPSKDHNHNAYICKCCLKAHIEKIGFRKNLGYNIVSFLSSSLYSQTGHNGYYLDGEVLFSC